MFVFLRSSGLPLNLTHIKYTTLAHELVEQQEAPHYEQGGICLQYQRLRAALHCQDPQRAHAHHMPLNKKS